MITVYFFIVLTSFEKPTIYTCYGQNKLKSILEVDFEQYFSEFQKMLKILSNTKKENILERHIRLHDNYIL